MDTVRKNMSHRPNHVAVCDADSGKILRWEEKGSMARARNPRFLAMHENPSSSHSESNSNSTMEGKDIRENATAVGGEFVDVVSDGASILAGDMLATAIFGTIEKQALQDQSDTVRNAVNIFGPGLAGVLVFNLSDSPMVKNVAVGHGLTAARGIVKLGIDTFMPDDDEEGTDSGDDGMEAYRALRGNAMKALPGLASGYSSEERSSIDTGMAASGTEIEGV